MKFIVGTKNAQKVSVVKRVVADIVKDYVLVEAIDIPSLVPDTPYNEETKQGAYNRARQLVKSHASAYCIGLESGLVERYDLLFEEAWACVCYKNQVYYGYSSGLVIPEYVRQKMEELNLEHGPTMNHIRGELGQFDDRDTWGTYSGKAILRTISIEEALRNALVQIFSPSESLYNK